MRMIGFQAVSFFVLSMLIGFSGCSNAKPPKDRSIGRHGKLRIAVIPKGTSHEFWKAIHAGAQKARSELKDVEIIWKGPQKEDDRAAQIKLMENMIVMQIDGIVLAPLDDTALVPPVAAARREQIPVVVIDSGLKSDDQIAYVATDNLAGGRKAGEQMAKLLGGVKTNQAPQDLIKKVVMLRYQAGSASTMQREEGFLEALKPYGNIRVVSENQRGGASVDSAMKSADNLLSQFMSSGALEIDGIFCPNESTTFGMLRVLQDRGFAGKVKFVGFDATDKLIDALKVDQIHGLLVQNPFQMGYRGVHTIVDYIRGREPTRQIDTGVWLVTKENLNDSEIQEVVYPPIKKWLGE